MDQAVTIGLDIAKSVFQVHGIDATGAVVVRRKLARGRVVTFFEALPRCQIGMEACNTSHYWASACSGTVRALSGYHLHYASRRQSTLALRCWWTRCGTGHE